MTWLLDTNVLIQAQRGWPVATRERLMAASPDDVAVSAISVAELWYGAAKSTDPEEKRALWSRLLEPYAVLPFDRAAGVIHGELRFRLRRSPIGERDLLIASVAVANDMAVVTDNERQFRRVKGLRVESWSR